VRGTLIAVIVSKIMGWARSDTRAVNIGNQQQKKKNFMKLKEKRLLGRPRNRWEQLLV
jgi:hypothetical protein